YQDLYQSMGYHHYRGTPLADDAELNRLHIDRIYDTYVDEERFEETDRAIGTLVERLPPRGYSSRELFEFLGRELPGKDSILATCARRGIPVFSPALIDSSIGIGLTLHYGKHRQGPRFSLDAVRDNYELVQILASSPRTGVIYIGGGTPKNWINDGIVMANYHYHREGEGHHYALQLTTDVPRLGGALRQHPRRGGQLGEDLEHGDQGHGVRGGLGGASPPGRRPVRPPEGLVPAAVPPVPLDGGPDHASVGRDRT
ncbi:deoxyhypusine synthase-like protein, partial [mine drainage metagenome]